MEIPVTHKYFVRAVLAVSLTVPLACSSAFGWATATHPSLFQAMDDNVAINALLTDTSLVSTSDLSAVRTYNSEPPNSTDPKWQDSYQWPFIVARSYVDTASPLNGRPWNTGLTETQRLCYLQHNTTDDSVPAHHAPANAANNSTYYEGLAEAYGLAHSIPSVTNTNSCTINGTTYNLTGTIDQVVTTFQTACVANAASYSSTLDVSTAVSNGFKIGQIFQRAVFADYLLAKKATVLTAHDYTGAVGGSISFDETAGSYDPDAITWNSNGTYSQNYGVSTKGLQHALWDFNGDVPTGGSWELDVSSMATTVSVSQLLSYGCPTDTWFPYYIATVDNEGKWATNGGQMYLSSGGLPEPGTITLLLSAAVAAFFATRRKRA